MQPDIQIKSIPMQFHCTGMMEIIKQLLRDKVDKNTLNEADLDVCLTEYAKYWYYSTIKGIKVIDAEGKKIE